MFQLEDPTTIDDSVTLTTKKGDKVTLGIVWRYIGPNERAALLRECTDHVQLFAVVIATWSGVGDSRGLQLPPTPRAIGALLDQLESEAPKQLGARWAEKLREAEAKN
jgi:hypothetical protein